MSKKLNIFQKIALINKLSKAAKQARKIAENNKELAADLQKALLNIKASFEDLARLLPSLKGVGADIKALFEIL